jgi:hypothetical protein
MYTADNYIPGGATVTPVGSHPISNGLSSFSANQWLPWGNGPKPSATVILETSSYDVGEVMTVESGRTVYLGPMYMERYFTYDNENLLDNTQPDAVELFLRAVEWAGGAI